MRTYSRFLSRGTALAGLLLAALPMQAIAASLTNPLGDITDPNALVARIVKSFLGVVGVIALLVIIYGGFEMLTSAGNQDRVERGRNALLWAFLGLLVIFGSYGILQAVFRVISGDSLI